MEIRLLGALEVIDNAGGAVPISGAKLRTLLAALAIRPGQVVSVDRLIDELWPADPPDGATNSLQVLISKLRRALPEPAISTRANGYALDVAAETIDVGRFQSTALTARKALTAGDAETASAAFRQALSLWRGPPLSEFAYDDFAQATITELVEERASVLEDRFDAELASGAHGEVVAELEAAVAAEPLRERLRVQLMLALYRCGRQADALRQFQDARRILGDELGLEPGPELRGLEAAILAQDPGLAGPAARANAMRTASHRRTNLRIPPTPTIGRVEQLAELRTLAATARLVTLIGPGGVGKTRLAVETGLGAVDGFLDGVWLVELGELRDPHDVVRRLAGALTITEPLGTGDDIPAARLVDVLTDRHMLLVLDNCEHLVEECAHLAEELLAGCPRLHILTTSREKLGLLGEVLWAVPPLTPEHAATLFAARAGDVAPGFSLTDESRPAVDDICARLDGLPLAVELAAARLRALPLTQIAALLDDRFRLLTQGPRTAAGRQQTLRAVVDWSYDLLFEDERRIFNRLAIFVDGCDLAAAHAVCADPLLSTSDVTDLLARLVDKSLIVPGSEDGLARFRMLRTLADYGRERLARSGELDAVERRHAAWYGALAEQGLPALAGHEQRRWLGQVTRELGNLGQAAETAVKTHDAQLAQTITGGLGWYWWIRGRADLGLRWLETSLQSSQQVHPITHAWAIAWVAFLSLLAGRPVRSTALIDEAMTDLENAGDAARLGATKLLAVQIYAAAGAGHRVPDLVREAGDQFLAAADHEPIYGIFVIWCRALLAQVTGDDEAAVRHIREFLCHPANGAHHACVFSLSHLADISEGHGRYEEAFEALNQARELAIELAMTGFDAPIAARLANLAMLMGDPAAADMLRSDALDTARRHGNTSTLAATWAGIAARQLRLGNLDAAASSAAPALVLYREAGAEAGSAAALLLLGWTSERAGDAPAAMSYFTRGFLEARRACNAQLCRNAAEGLAAACAIAEDWERAARLLGVASRLHPQSSAPLSDVPTITGVMFLSGGDHHAIDRTEHDARQHLGAQAFDDAYAAGAATHADDLIRG